MLATTTTKAAVTIATDLIKQFEGLRLITARLDIKQLVTDM